jgi:hypothetical protein
VSSKFQLSLPLMSSLPHFANYIQWEIVLTALALVVTLGLIYCVALLGYKALSHIPRLVRTLARRMRERRQRKILVAQQFQYPVTSLGPSSVSCPSSVKL